MEPNITKSKEDWKKELAPEKFHVLIEKGTEPPFTGTFNKHDKEGVYVCGGCGQELFRSEEKYDSGSGWPSFWTPMSNDKVKLKNDNSLGMHRTEVVCSRCGGHLGHVFDDGPQPTGERYCINSLALEFEEGK
ncbi:MAG: peptide-methionine (R)-S-oxide reductase MsrB [Methanosarcinales archaeon]|nr:peptide-methionine (R)-S-oxide reductase MsrB [Methanosarcinales archaeon]